MAAKSWEFTPWLMKAAEGKPEVVTATAGGSIYIPFLRQMQRFGLGKTDLVVPDFVSEEDLIKGVKQLGKNGGNNVIWFSRYASPLADDRPAEFDKPHSRRNVTSIERLLRAMHVRDVKESSSLLRELLRFLTMSVYFNGLLLCILLRLTCLSKCDIQISGYRPISSEADPTDESESNEQHHGCE